MNHVRAQGIPTCQIVSVFMVDASATKVADVFDRS